MRICLPRAAASRDLLLFFVLGLTACAHSSAERAAREPTPQELEALAARMPEFRPSEYGERVRAQLTERSATLRECYVRALGGRSPTVVTTTTQLYVSPGALYFPKHSSSAIASTFERCLLERLQDWPLPSPIAEYEGAWVQFHFHPAGTQALAPGFSTPLFELDDARGFLEVTGRAPLRRLGAVSVLPDGEAPPVSKAMTPPRRLSAGTIQPSDEARAQHVKGTFEVFCTITEAGDARYCRVLHPVPYMERPVLTFLHAQQFAPALSAGKPVAVTYLFRMDVRT